MTATLAEIRTDVRNRIDEAEAGMWEDDELDVWINEGLRDVARRSETLLDYYTNLQAVAGVAKYLLPSDVIRLHRVEFQIAGDQQTYPLQPSTYQEMDSVWGVQPGMERYVPSYFVLWGFAPKITIQLYPVPSQAGTINLYYYRLPKPLTEDEHVAEIPEGWHDLVSLYVEYVAKRKDRNPSWQEAKILYEERITNMIDVTRQLHDQARTVTVGTSAIPGWLYEFDD